MTRVRVTWYAQLALAVFGGLTHAPAAAVLILALTAPCLPLVLLALHGPAGPRALLPGGTVAGIRRPLPAISREEHHHVQHLDVEHQRPARTRTR